MPPLTRRTLVAGLVWNVLDIGFDPESNTEIENAVMRSYVGLAMTCFSVNNFPVAAILFKDEKYFSVSRKLPALSRLHLPEQLHPKTGR